MGPDRDCRSPAPGGDTCRLMRGKKTQEGGPLDIQGLCPKPAGELLVTFALQPPEPPFQPLDFPAAPPGTPLVMPCLGDLGKIKPLCVHRASEPEPGPVCGHHFNGVVIDRRLGISPEHEVYNDALAVADKASARLGDVKVIGVPELPLLRRGKVIRRLHPEGFVPAVIGIG